MRKIICGMIIALLTASFFPLAFNIQLAKAEPGTVYIKADGSIDPTSAPISNVGNVYYTFTADIYDSIVVEPNNIVVDGAGHVLEGTGTGGGIDLSGRSNVTVKSITIRKFDYGIYLYGSSGNTLYANTITNSTWYGIWLYSSSGNNISANTITNNTYDGIVLESSSNSNSISANTITNNNKGIWLYSSSNSNSISANTITNNTYGIVLESSSNSNSISANTITNNYSGITLDSSSGNSISANTITKSSWGIYLSSSSNNLICHNNFAGNTAQVYVTLGYANTWDDGYPSGGNYWSNYAGVDLYKGPNQNVAGSDGIGDTPYVIDANNKDHYPLMKPWALATDLASLVVRGQNNIIYYRTHNVTTASWAGWNALPGATFDSPAAAVCGNELHLVVRGMDSNTLWHGYVNLIGGGFSGWTLLSGSTPSAPTLTSNGTALSLAVRGQNNLIYHRFYTVVTRTWTGWAALPTGSTCDGPAATILGNKLHIVVRGMDGYSIWHSSVDLSTQAFSGWDLVGGATESKPTLAACESRNEIVLVVRGLNNVIYRNSWAGSSWAGWAGLPTGSTCDGIGATVIGETLHVVVRGMDGNTLWHANVDLATSTFSGWALLDGSTPSAPTLTS